MFLQIGISIEGRRREGAWFWKARGGGEVGQRPFPFSIRHGYGARSRPQPHGARSPRTTALTNCPAGSSAPNANPSTPPPLQIPPLATPIMSYFFRFLRLFACVIHSVFLLFF
jgi:hypothetical protein